MQAEIGWALPASMLLVAAFAHGAAADEARTGDDDAFAVTTSYGAHATIAPAEVETPGADEPDAAAEPAPPQLRWSDGVDNRTAWNSYENPRSKIGAFYRRNEPDWRPMCTGASLGPRVILTAAHCMFTKDGELEDVTFHPAHDAALGRDALSTYEYDLVYHVNGYVTRRCFAHPEDPYCLARDYALVVLTRATTVGSFGFGGQGAGWGEFASWYKVSGGYPLDWRGALVRSDGCATGRQFVDGSYAEFEHGCDVATGQSGSPIWTSTHPTLKGNIIIGVVSANVPCVAPACRNPVPGSATRITQAVANLIHEVRAKHP